MRRFSLFLVCLFVLLLSVLPAFADIVCVPLGSGYQCFITETPAPAPTHPPIREVTPAPLPRCEEHNFIADSPVRAVTPDRFDYAAYCRVLSDPAQIGVTDAIAAVDIFSPVGLATFPESGVFCLRGEGVLLWRAARHAPRVTVPVEAFSVDEFAGFTCALLGEPGTLALVGE